MKLKTVNVVLQGKHVDEMFSFTDDAEGNAEAERIFKDLAIVNNLTEDAIEVALEDGYFDSKSYVKNTNNSFTCKIIHSS
jgi:hypothetical protein